MGEKMFPTIGKSTLLEGREKDTIVADLHGALLKDRSSFPYFALVAYDVSGILRLFFLLLASPVATFFHYFISESAGIQVLIFATFVGVKVSDIESAARAVLPKFYVEDLHPRSWGAFSSREKRCVLTSNPRIMVEPFLKEHLGVDMVLGTEIETYKGRATGFVKSPGVLAGKNKADVLKKTFGTCDDTDIPFMTLDNKESYFVSSKPNVTSGNLPKPVIFHDGRLVRKPTHLMALFIILWIPVGFLLACIRMIIVGLIIPMPLKYYACWAFGIRITIKGIPLPFKNIKNRSSGGSGSVLFICNHRTLIDFFALSVALGRRITTVTYSVSRISEILSPIKTTRLARDRASDAFRIKELLKEGDVSICPEGTTCREPYLLRFSSLFAELSDELVPVAIANKMTMFHATSARGGKWMDPFYFLMDPSPAYEVTFLDKLSPEFTGKSGKTNHEVANHIQRIIAETLSYKCTTLTRKDKYGALAGNDGTVLENRQIMKRKV